MRQAAAISAALWLAPLLGAGMPAERAATGGPPNILFLLSDDQRWDTLGCMGNPVIRTPHLDGLARQGVLFRNAFVTTSVCGPSRTSIMAGNYARARGVELSQIMRLDDPGNSLPAVLRRGGYETGYVGKWGIGGESGFRMGLQLFDYWSGDRYHGNYWHEADCPFVTNDGRKAKAEIRCTCPPKGSLPRVGHADLRQPVHTDRDVVPAKVKQFLSGRDPKRPFLLCISFRSPKDPWSDYSETVSTLNESDRMPAPRTATREAAARQPAFLQKSMGAEHGHRMAGDPAALANEMRKYYRQVTTMDGAVGEIRRLLGEQGVSDNTIVIFTSDNGHFLGEHGFWGKWTPYEGSIRVPLIVFDPRAPRERRGIQREEMVLNIDLAPTMLALAGCPVPRQMQGRDFTPLLRGEHLAWRTDWFYEHTWTADGRIAPSEAVRSEEWKYIRFIGETPVVEQLFNLKSDPEETGDRITDPACSDVLNRMRAKLDLYKRDLAKRS